MVERDVTLAAMTGGRVHIAHTSARDSLRAVRAGKDRGAKVTCEVAPHHFTLTDAALEGYDTNTKMNPPLRDERDRDAMLEGLADGTVDVIATDHAPHHHDEKHVEFDRAPFGIVGLETAVALVFHELVHKAVITPARMVELMSANPARILNVPGGSLSEGVPADITLLAPDLTVTVDVASFRSRARNSPFHGWTLQGGVAATLVGGRLMYVNDAVRGMASLLTAYGTSDTNS